MKKRVKIEGMTCMHCANRVETALKDLASVIKVKVKLKQNEALIKLTEEINDKLITDVINESGYKVIEII